MVVSKRAHHHRVRISTSCYTRLTPMHASTVLVRVSGGQLCPIGRTSKTCLVLCPRLTCLFFCCAKHVLYQVSYVKHSFACFGNSSISHTQMRPHLGHGTPKNGRGVRGRLLCGRGVLRLFVFWQGAVTPDFPRCR